MQPMRVVIVDDERLARQRIRRLLADEPDVEIAGEFANSRQASQYLRDAHTDLLFLDIQMPLIDGFALLNGIGAHAVSAVIFVTAYEHYAVRAFEVRAQDYLLKPYEESRFRAAVQRARSVLQFSGIPGGAVSDPKEDRRGRRDAVLVRAPGKAWFVDVNQIDWIESADNYSKLHVGRENYLVRETMAAFESKLPAWNFARIHRSTIVNLVSVLEFQQWFNGDYQVVLKDGQKLRMSRTYRERVQDLLGRSI